MVQFVPPTQYEIARTSAGLDLGEVDKLDRLYQTLRNPKFPRRTRDRAGDAISRMIRAHEAKVAGNWALSATQETLALAQARGELVAKAVATGPAMISSRDGLRRLFDTGYLSEGQLDAGLTYRLGWEARDDDMKVANYGRPSANGGHDNERYVLMHLNRAKRTMLVEQIDRAVLLGCPTHPTALAMMRRIAGEGHSLSAYGEGRALARNRDALIAGLDRARDVISKAA